LDYLGAADGKIERRFALYGLPVRLPHRFVPALIADHINNFATAPDGSWVASSGDLGLAVFSRDGKILWQQDWWKTQRHEARLAAVDNQTLLVAEGITLSAYDAHSGSRRWQQTLATGGEVREIRLSKDGKTIAILANTEGGRVFVLRDGKFIATIPTSGEEIDLSPD